MNSHTNTWAAESVISGAFCFWHPQATRRTGQHDTHIPVVINDSILDGKVDYIASAPPDYRASFSGSALPFASQAQALEDTPNTGTITGVSEPGARVTIPLLYPNSFYVGSHLVHPTVFLRYKISNKRHAHIAVKIGESVPFRTLYPPSAWYDGASYYEKKHEPPVTTQERVLVNSAYPADFWEKRPA